MPKIARQYAPVLFAVFMSCMMSFIMTCMVTMINTGTGSGFLLRWMRAFMLAWPLACICILLFGNRVRRVVALLTSS